MSDPRLDDRNDGRFPDGADVEVRWPLTDRQRAAGRDTWPWVAGFVVGQCGPNEWDVVVAGAGPVDFDSDGEPLYPMVFRDSSELRTADQQVRGADTDSF